MSIIVLKCSLPEILKIIPYILLHTNDLFLPSDKDKGDGLDVGMSDMAERYADHRVKDGGEGSCCSSRSVAVWFH